MFARSPAARPPLFAAAIVLSAIVGPAAAFETMYPRATLQADAPRLRTAVERIHNAGLAAKLTTAERKAIGPVVFEYPLPERGDDLLNFYAAFEQQRSVVVLPVLSLKALEDLATAYAWLYHHQHSLSTIDLYFAMMRRKPEDQWPGGRYPPLLKALGVPANALKEKKVDALSLSLRNEAFLFLIAHELGHTRYRHKGYDEITTAQARADEVQSDTFALDIMGRTGTPPLGAVLFFQAQAYLMPHRGEFSSQNQWERYLRKVSTHPLSVARIDAMANYIAGPLVRARPTEKAVWSLVARKLRSVTTILSDVALQRCVAKLAAKAGNEALSPRKTVAASLMQKHCG